MFVKKYLSKKNVFQPILFFQKNMKIQKKGGNEKNLNDDILARLALFEVNDSTYHSHICKLRKIPSPLFDIKDYDNISEALMGTTNFTEVFFIRTGVSIRFIRILFFKMFSHTFIPMVFSRNV